MTKEKTTQSVGAEETAKPVKKTRTTRKKATKPAETAEAQTVEQPQAETEPKKTPRTAKAKAPRKTKKVESRETNPPQPSPREGESRETNLPQPSPGEGESQESRVESLEIKAEQTVETPAEQPVEKVQEPKTAQKAEQPKRQEIKFIKPTKVIRDLVELSQAPVRQIVLNDQQIQQLTLEQAEERHLYLEQTLARVLDYDIVITDTNIWLELLVGHSSSHSDPRVNARLQFERQLEFISKMTRYRKGKFLMMAETYEEIDRFATQQEPTDYKDADFSDNALCLNVAARLAKRLILSQQRENRLRIEGIGAESHHSAFADPAIIRRTVELFAQGKKVLLITNDASVAIRSMGLCDDLQRFNNIDDETWERDYAPLRPMACTFDDLKMLDQYTRQYHFIQQAAGKMWMEDIPQERESHEVMTLKLWMEAFRPGDRHRPEQPKMPQQQNQQKQNQPKQQNQQQKQNQPKQQKQQQKQAEQKPVAAEQKPVVVEQKPQAEEQKPIVAEVQQPQAEAQQPKAEPQQQKTDEQKPKRRPQRRGGRKKPSKEGAPQQTDAQPVSE